MTDRIASTGSVIPAVFMGYRAGKRAAGTIDKADDKFVYVLKNECVYEFRIDATTPSGTYAIVRHATKDSRQFDADLGTYTADAIAASALNAIFDASDAKQLKIRVTLKVWFHQFYHELLTYLTRTEADTANLANPSAPAEVEGSFDYKSGPSGSKATITHKVVQREIANVPAELAGWDIVPRPNKSPAVKLYFYLRNKEDLAAADRDANARVLAACDYTKLALLVGNTVKDKPQTPTDKLLLAWRTNVAVFLVNYTDLTRGERIKQEIIGIGRGAAGGPQAVAVKTVRDAVDARMVTANHWGDRRESWTTERLQKKLSDLFGALQQSHFAASPVSFIRGFRDAFPDTFKPDNEKFTALALQFGTGHCGEHSVISFVVVKALMAGPPGDATFVNVVWSGQYNVDHAFCVGGATVKVAYETSNPLVRGEEADYFDMRTLLQDNPGVDGWVLDPYLDPSAQAATVTGLLTKLNGPSRGALRTRYLRYVDQFPGIPPLIFDAKRLP